MDLRSLDWRFLLGNTRWAKVGVIGRTDGSGDGIGAIAGTIANLDEIESRDCDLVLAHDPSDRALQRVSSALSSAGYASLLFPSARHVFPQLERRFEETGLEAIATYTGWPAESPRRWLPIDDPVAVSWLAKDAHPGLLEHPRRWFRWMAWVTRRRAGFIPAVVLARPRSSPSNRTTGRPVPLPLLDPATPLGALVIGHLGIPRPNIQYGPVVVVAEGQRSWSKVVFLFLRNDRPEPLLVLKVARVPQRAFGLYAKTQGLRREAETLNALAERGLGPGDAVPHVVGDAVVEGSQVLLETAFSGAPRRIGRRLDNATLLDTVGSATEWLIRLAQRTAREPVDPDARRATALGALDRFAACFNGFANLPEADRNDLAAALAHLPIVAEHRDFAPWNLLWGRGRLTGVVDWESSELEGWPGLDLLYFLAYVSFGASGAVRTDRQLDAYRASKQNATPMGRIAKDAIDRYLRALKIDPALVPLLRRFVWAIHAPNEYARAVDDHGSTPPRDVLERGLLLSLWREENVAGR